MGLWIFKVLAMSLISTIVLELLIALVEGVRNKMDILLVVLVNILTNPFVVSVYYITLYYTRLNRILIVLLLEVSAVVVEWICYRYAGDKIKRPFLLSLSANCFSYFTGLIFDYLLRYFGG